MAKNRSFPTKRRMAPTPDAGDLLRDASYPERLRQIVYLASKGIAGPRKCLLCAYTGATTRVYIPEEALRIDPTTPPDTRGVVGYFLCSIHAAQTQETAVIAAALRARKGKA
jgi:hypothetical protein